MNCERRTNAEWNPVRVFKMVLILLLLPVNMIAQEKGTEELPTRLELLKYDGLSALGGVKKTYTQPFHWEKDDYLVAGTIILGTGALYLFDEESTEWFYNQREDIPGVVKDFGWYYGSPQNNYAVNGAVYLYGLFTRNEEIRKTGVLLISAASAAGILQSFSKTITGRARPGTGEGKGSFKPFSSEGKYHSFPSGHTILSFTTAYAIGKQFDNPFVKGGIYALGMVAPVSRLWAGAHWFSDVALSVAISVVVVDVIDKYLDEERNYGDPRKDKISWNFQVGLGRAGIIGTF
ncbi:phosphatase PAP2 family protein [Salinimicrobium flavum]|uniref:Phosphatase PAP2 family protein n=1 Tax=Salinimicrobium flavum TaxID=1737065 RepID=A0ABW5J0H4_9FLAO